MKKKVEPVLLYSDIEFFNRQFNEEIKERQDRPENFLEKAFRSRKPRYTASCYTDNEAVCYV